MRRPTATYMPPSARGALPACIVGMTCPGGPAAREQFHADMMMVVVCEGRRHERTGIADDHDRLPKPSLSSSSLRIAVSVRELRPAPNQRGGQGLAIRSRRPRTARRASETSSSGNSSTSRCISSRSALTRTSYAERLPHPPADLLPGAACQVCLFVAETTCERGHPACSTAGSSCRSRIRSSPCLDSCSAGLRHDLNPNGKNATGPETKLRTALDRSTGGSAPTPSGGGHTAQGAMSGTVGK
jgi:hypothetical protein